MKIKCLILGHDYRESGGRVNIWDGKEDIGFQCADCYKIKFESSGRKITLKERSRLQIEMFKHWGQ